jgi:dihydrofolate reductase
MQAIVAVDKLWGIGKKNGLLFHLPEDLQYFKRITLGKVIVMGGNTLLSFPGSKPLPGRTNIVLSDVFTREDCKVLMTLPELLKELQNYSSDDIFIVGGAMFYRTMLPYCKKAYVTKVDADGGAEVFFENLDKMDNWKLVEEVGRTISNGYPLTFTIYENLNPKPIDG